MLTLISSIAGFLTSGVPKVLEFVQDKSDKKQEIQIMQMQMERELALQAAGFQAKKEVAEIEYDRTIVESEVREVESLHKFSAQLIFLAGIHRRLRLLVRRQDWYGIYRRNSNNLDG